MLHMAEVKSRAQGSRPKSRTQKIQDLEYTFQGQILLRPRTGLLEAKAKDTARKCFSKKKVYAQNVRKFFANFRQFQKKIKVFAHKFTNFSQSSCVKNFFWKFSNALTLSPLRRSWCWLHRKHVFICFKAENVFSAEAVLLRIVHIN